jgi:soluble lytic murein transglycosylase-like protein
MLMPALLTHAQEREVRQRAQQFEPLIAEAASRYGVDPHLLWTIAYLESGFRTGQTSPKGARGLMQFIRPTAERYGLKDPYNSGEAMNAAARYVRDLQSRFGGRGDLILAAYNAGEGAVEAYREGRRVVMRDGKIINPDSIRTGGIPPYLETRDYVARGRNVYQNIIREGIFPDSERRVMEDQRIRRPPNNPESKDTPSIYASRAAEPERTADAENVTSDKGETGEPDSIYVD